MRLIVDAWNVLHVEGVLPPGLAGLDLVGLGRLMHATRWADGRGTLVCDGAAQPRPAGLPGSIHVLWSGHAREADDIIEDLIAATSSPRRLTIVSTDNRLKRAAKRRRCHWLSSHAFLRTILDDLSRAPRSASPSEATEERAHSEEDWDALFALAPDELAALESEADAADLPGPASRASPPPPAPRATPTPPPVAPPPMTFPDSVLEQARRIAGGD